MGLQIEKGQRKNERLQAGTYRHLNIEFVNASATSIEVDLSKIFLGLKRKTQNSSGGVDVIQYSPLITTVHESALTLNNMSLFQDKPMIIVPGNYSAYLTIDLELYIQLIGNDKLELDVDLKQDSCADDYEVNITYPQEIGVMESLPNIEVYEIPKNATKHTATLGGDIERITLVTYGPEIVQDLRLNSDKYNPNFVHSDLCVQTAEFMEYFENSNFDYVPLVIFDGTKAESEINLYDVKIDVLFDTPVVNSFFVVRKAHTNVQLLQRANTLRAKHAKKAITKKLRA